MCHLVSELHQSCRHFSADLSANAGYFSESPASYRDSHMIPSTLLTPIYSAADDYELILM